MKLRSFNDRKGSTLKPIFSFIFTILLLAAPGVVAAKDNPLSPKDRVKVFDQVWRDINENYYSDKFNGVDWSKAYQRYRPQIEAARDDQEFYAILRKMVGELHDTHTRVHTPEERAYREHKQGVTVGVRLYEIEGKPTVIYVARQSEAEEQGVKPGMQVLAIDGVDIAQRVVKTRDLLGAMSSDRALETSVYGRLLRGEPGSIVSIRLQGLDGRIFTVSLKRRIVDAAAQVTYKRLEGGFGYIKLTAWESPADFQFAAAMTELRDAPGLIIDLRGNGGGEAGIVFKIASMFFKERISLGKFITRGGRVSETFSTPHKENVYDGPVTILVDEISASGSELFAGVMQEYGRARVIGRESCGCLLVIQNLRKLRGGGELTVSELDVQTPKGKRLEGDGVIPDQVVPLTRNDLMNGRDAVMEAAVRKLIAEAHSNKSEKNVQRVQTPTEKP
ncbi:MAG TPA: S41 family peptidase [Blastocatellia bacterium]|nr:S41 family peptidase [Blastocatellia bacterium]